MTVLHKKHRTKRRLTFAVIGNLKHSFFAVIGLLVLFQIHISTPPTSLYHYNVTMIDPDPINHQHQQQPPQHPSSNETISRQQQERRKQPNNNDKIINNTRVQANTTISDPAVLRDHPHMGAKDEYGNWGYVHDPTILVHTPWPFLVRSNERTELCARVGEGIEWEGGRGDGGETSAAVALAKQFFQHHIQVGTPSTVVNGTKNDDTNNTSPSNNSSGIKVFCAIYTYPGNNDLTDAIRETWGGRCDGFMAASTETNHSAGTVHLPHYGSNEGRYEGIWQKVRSMVAYLYDNFLLEYDFFYICGDDTYLIMENLKSLLTSPQFVTYAGGTGYPNPIYLGDWIHPSWLPQYHDSFYYMGGGSGYVLNRSTLRALVEQVWPICHNTTDKSMEDLFMGACLEEVLNVTGYDARDDDGRDRFIGIDPIVRASIGTESGIRPPQYLKKQFRWRARRYGWKTIYGIDAISPSAVAFHLIKPASKMRRYERLLYRSHLDDVDCAPMADETFLRSSSVTQ